jgi:hypothetical protein
VRQIVSNVTRNSAKYLNVRSNKSSAQDDEAPPFAQFVDEMFKLPLSPSSPLATRTAEAMVPDDSFGEEEDVCSEDIKDIWF